MIKVYKYGLLTPTENLDKILQSIWLSHRSYNNYIANEIEYRNKIRASRKSDVVSELEVKLDLANQELELLITQAKQKRIELRSKKIPKDNSVSLQRLVIKDLKQKLKDARKESKNTTLEKQFSEDRKGQKNAIYADAIKDGSYWGVQLIVQDRVDRASKIPLYDGVEPNNPRFKNWTGEGQIGVQIQKDSYHGKDMIGKDLYNNDNTMIQIIKTPGPTSGKRSINRAVLKIRIGSENKKPIWGVFPMIYHRPIPDNAKITWAKINRYKVGSSYKWSVDITIEETADETLTSETDLAVALDIGWRQFDDHIRLITYEAEDGSTGNIDISNKLIGSLKKSKEINSVRTKEFNTAKQTLCDYLKTITVPDWIKQFSQSAKAKKENTELPSCEKSIAWISQWRSIARLCKLITEWKNNRIDGDNEIFDIMSKWKYHDFHLWNWEANQREQSFAQRKEFYRLEALKLAKKYKILVIEDFDLTSVKKCADFNSKKEVERNDTASSNLQLVAIGELREIIINTFIKYGGRVVKINPKNTSKTCPVCGTINEIGTQVNHTCTGCGTVWDRDSKAAKNILALWCESLGGNQTTGASRNDEITNENNGVQKKRWAKVNEMKKEKKAILEAARNTVANAAE